MAKSSSHDSADPYTVLLNWKEGRLTYWRGNGLYSEATKAKLEARLKAMVKRELHPRDHEKKAVSPFGSTGK